ncbi:MAG: DUF4013 domain-containing protein [Natronomonas sp.]
MDRAVLGYPVRGRTGVRSLAALSGAVLAAAIGLRYAAALLPLSLALLGLLVSVCAAAVLAGYLSCVLVSPDASPPTPPLREVVTAGFSTLGLVVVAVLWPISMLLVTILALEEGEAAGSGESVLFLVGSTGAFLLFLAVSYVLPAVVGVGRREGRLTAALDRRRLLSILRDTGYLLRWVVGFSVLVLAGGLFSLVVESGGVVGVGASVLVAYGLLVGTRILGIGYREADPV